MDLLKKECKKLGLSTQNEDFSLERFLGSLRMDEVLDETGTLDPTAKIVPEGVMGACYHEPFYYVWEGITRYKDGSAQVNLLLNRAAEWLDLDSYLPYEGKVIIKNKTCSNIAVRIPAWVDRKELSFRIGKLKLKYFWVGNYATLTGLNGKEEITIDFPMVETVETCYLLTRDVGPKWWEHTDSLPEYIFHLKGNTCVKVEFPNRSKFTDVEPLYPVFQRDHYRANKAPMKKITRYIAPRLINW